MQITWQGMVSMAGWRAKLAQRGSDGRPGQAQGEVLNASSLGWNEAGAGKRQQQPKKNMQDNSPHSKRDDTQAGPQEPLYVTVCLAQQLYLRNRTLESCKPVAGVVQAFEPMGQ